MNTLFHTKYTTTLYLMVVVMLGCLSTVGGPLTTAVGVVYCEVQFCVTAPQICRPRSEMVVLIITHH